MIQAKCDNHPDRDAVTTIAIKVLPSGTRPTPFGLSSLCGIHLDFCSECKEALRAISGEKVFNLLHE